MEETPSTKRRIGPLRLIIGAILALVLMTTMLLLHNGTFQAMEVISSSMEPTLERGDRVIVRQVNNGDSILIGDIVTFDSPVDAGAPIVKRVAATPGDMVEVRNRQLLVNGTPSRWPGRDLPWAVELRQFIVPPDYYFVVGENSYRSEDSFSFGPIGRNLIIGRVWYRYAPGDRRGVVK